MNTYQKIAFIIFATIFALIIGTAAYSITNWLGAASILCAGYGIGVGYFWNYLNS